MTDETQLTMERQGNTLDIVATVDDQVVFAAAPSVDAEHADRVAQSAIHTWVTRAWPHLTTDNGNNGGAFQ